MAALLGFALTAAGGVNVGIDAADAAEPPPAQVLSARIPPRAGSLFSGVAVATLEEGARAYRSVTPWCTAGRIRARSGRSLSVPVRIARLPRDPQAGGAVRSVTTCSWQVPRGARGRRLLAYVVVDFVNADGTSARTSQIVEWVVR